MVASQWGASLWLQSKAVYLMTWLVFCHRILHPFLSTWSWLRQWQTRSLLYANLCRVCANLYRFGSSECSWLHIWMFEKVLPQNGLEHTISAVNNIQCWNFVENVLICGSKQNQKCTAMLQNCQASASYNIIILNCGNKFREYNSTKEIQ